jgi:hypothetical protein
MDVGTGLTVWYFVVFLLDFGTVLTVVFCCFSIRTVLTVWYYVIFLLELSWQCGITLSEHFQHPWKTTKYHTVRTVPIEKKQNTTLSGQFQHGILLFFYWILELSWLWYFVVFHGCWNCPDSVVFCYFSITTVLYINLCCGFSSNWHQVLCKGRQQG